jgi:hypothetical protein
LATAIYFGQNDIVKESLGLILASVSPWSVDRYLGFAIGSGIGEEEREGEDAEPARGLEEVGKSIQVDGRRNPSRKESAETARSRRRSLESPATPDDDTPTVKHEDPESSEDGLKCSSPSGENLTNSASTLEVKTEPEEDLTIHDGDADPHLDYSCRRYFYGFAGDKIGEACACWLARWAVDILEVEEAMAGIRHDDSVDSALEVNGGSPVTRNFASLSIADQGSSLKYSGSRTRRSKSVSWQPSTTGVIADTPHISTLLASAASSSASEQHGEQTLCIWGHNGLPAHWVRAVISSDALFVKNEIERYRFAKRVVELRRHGREKSRSHKANGDIGVKEGYESDGEDWDAEEEEEEEEEAELQEIFKSGIYYSHMASQTHDILHSSVR